MTIARTSGSCTGQIQFPAMQAFVSPLGFKFLYSDDYTVVKGELRTRVTMNKTLMRNTNSRATKRTLRGAKILQLRRKETADSSKYIAKLSLATLQLENLEPPIGSVSLGWLRRHVINGLNKHLDIKSSHSGEYLLTDHKFGFWFCEARSLKKPDNPFRMEFVFTVIGEALALWHSTYSLKHPECSLEHLEIQFGSHPPTALAPSGCLLNWYRS